MPVRPIPDWISSKISSAPVRSHAARAACRSSSGKHVDPALALDGSRITAAVPSSTAPASQHGRVLGATATKPGTSGANGACLVSWGVADSAP